MKSKTFFTLALLFLLKYNVIYAQAIFVTGENYMHVPSARDFGVRYAVDTCNLFVTYQYNFVVDTANMERYNEPTILEIGDNVNRFYSRHSEIQDSMMFDILYDLNNNRGRVTGVRTPDFLQLDLNEFTTYHDVYTYSKTNIRVVSARFSETEYRYNEDIEQLNWEILPETDTIVGYLCNKAETEFRGRKWYAWFATELPYNFGPWKLGGLPGLILKAEDSEKMFNWTAIGIVQPKNRLINDYSEKAKQSFFKPSTPDSKYRIVKCKRKDVAKLWKRQWVSPISMLLIENKELGIYVKSGGTYKERVIDMNDLPDIYYPKLELDL